MKLMGWSDVGLLVKKIAIGIIVTVIPFVILFGGLWLTKKILSPSKPQSSITSKQ